MHDLVEEWDTGLRSVDMLGFPGYAEKLRALDGESVRTGRTVAYVLVESRFDVLGGSMGAVAGEKVVRAFDRATAAGLPVVCLTRSGGARMQEGMVALLQMGRTAAAVGRHQAAGLLSVAVHRSPTTGGVFASYGSLCDVRAVEEGATIGFAGPRVVEQTIGEDVEGRSHSAATALAHGLVDAIVPVDGWRPWVELVLGLREQRLDPRILFPAPADEPATGAWAEVQRARRTDRPTGIDVAAAICDSWVGLGGADPTVRGGLAVVAGMRCVVLANDRHAGGGRITAAGFRQARRAIALAGRLGLPLLTLVDTPGADPSSASENGGIAGEIAHTFAAMETLPTRSVSVCVGEGGSGGALALAWADSLLIQEHAVFSVIGPEGAAAILEHDALKADRVAESLALTSEHLAQLGIVDAVVPEDPAALVGPVADAMARPAGRGRKLRSTQGAPQVWVDRVTAVNP